MTPELESAFYELLAAARAVSNMPLGEGHLPRLDHMVQLIDDITENPPTRRVVPVSKREPAPWPEAPASPQIRSMYYDPR
jgi:hypothetical protein